MTSPWAELFTGDGLTLDIAALRAAIARAKLKIELVPIDLKLVDHLLENTIDMRRLEETIRNPRPALTRPVIFCVSPTGSRMLVDGHHRYVLSALVNAKRIGAHICYPALWQQFQL